MVSGLAGGAPPPGAPLESTGGNYAITGGTGAFLGARGQEGVPPIQGQSRQASVTEDPGRRRALAGGLRLQVLLHLLPMTRPEVVSSSSGLAVFHSELE